MRFYSFPPRDPIFSSYHKTTRLAHELGEDEFWLYDDDDDDALEDEDADWEYFDEAAAAAEEAAKPQFLKARNSTFPFSTPTTMTFTCGEAKQV